MTPEERQLITGLFDRMRGFTLAEKDGEAEALIKDQVQSLRDAPYMLVQSVLVQEHALQQADTRIRELEEQVRELQSADQPQAGGSGSFLGSLFGGRPASEPTRGGTTSVPAIGARATPSVYDSRGGWTPQGPEQQPGGPFARAAQQPGGGGFLRSAMATAAGVAGGMLVAGAISNMLGGHSANAGTGSTQQTPDANSAASNEGAKEIAQPQETAQPQDAAASSNASQEPVYQETADTDDGWFGGDGGDFDI
jgi:uncharacterized protein